MVLIGPPSALIGLGSRRPWFLSACPRLVNLVLIGWPSAYQPWFSLAYPCWPRFSLAHPRWPRFMSTRPWLVSFGSCRPAFSLFASVLISPYLSSRSRLVGLSSNRPRFSSARSRRPWQVGPSSSIHPHQPQLPFPVALISNLGHGQPRLHCPLSRPTPCRRPWLPASWDPDCALTQRSRPFAPGLSSSYGPSIPANFRIIPSLDGNSRLLPLSRIPPTVPTPSQTPLVVMTPSWMPLAVPTSLVSRLWLPSFSSLLDLRPHLRLSRLVIPRTAPDSLLQAALGFVPTPRTAPSPDSLQASMGPWTSRGVHHSSCAPNYPPWLQVGLSNHRSSLSGHIVRPT